MLAHHYPVEASPDFQTFEFVSEGQNGSIVKVVRFTEINLKNFFNLGFGDKDPSNGFLCDLSVTNNGDSQKVLATVVATLYVFFEMNPEATVIATGSTAARNRLYRMGIANNLAEAEKDFILFGLTNSKWEPFQTGKNYKAFLVRRKL
jgi:hypothetical protein